MDSMDGEKKQWQRDKAASDIYISEIKHILVDIPELHIIDIGTDQEDKEENTDLKVLLSKDLRIGVRVRTWGFHKYAAQFTIRSCRYSGIKTEHAKIMEGWGNYFFYGFGDGQKILYWTFADLDIFRVANVEGTQYKNDDGSSEFLVYRWDQFPSNFRIAGGYAKE